MTDLRPANCRFRLHDEGKPYPRSGCQGCGKTIMSGLGNKCDMTDENELVERGARRAIRHEPNCGGYDFEDHPFKDRLMKEVADAFSTIRPGDRLPGGMVAVPYEPTDEMVKFGSARVGDFYSEKGEYPRTKAMWRAMLDAAKGE